MKVEKRENLQGLIPLSLGEFMSPFTDLDKDALQKTEPGLVNESFYLSGVGKIKVELVPALVMDYPTTTQFIARGSDGNPILKDIPPELYELQVTVALPDDVQPGDGQIRCTLSLKGLELSSPNEEASRPEVAGYAVFLSWKASTTDPNETLLLPIEFISDIQLMFSDTEQRR